LPGWPAADNGYNAGIATRIPDFFRKARMRGPHERLKYDFRRVWECPACHHRERTGGEITTRLCMCQRKVDPMQRVWMKLVHEGGRRPDLPKFDPASFISAESESDLPPEAMFGDDPTLPPEFDRASFITAESKPNLPPEAIFADAPTLPPEELPVTPPTPGEPAVLPDERPES
jgi:hypothetical protein